MKKDLIIKIVLTIIIITVLTIVCGLFVHNNLAITSGEVTIQVEDIDGNLVINDKHSFKQNDTPLDILKEHYTLRIEEGPLYTFIYDIGEVKTDGSGTFLSIMVNGETSPVGLAEIELEDDMVLRFVETKIIPWGE